MNHILRTATLCTLLACSAAHSGEHDLPGFVTAEKEGRLWVFKADSKEYADFQNGSEPAKQFSDIGSGPNGMTVKAADQTTLQEYLAAIKKK